MSRPWKCLCIALILGHGVHVRHLEAQTPSARVRALAGCYTLTLGKWSGPLPATGDPAAHTPPAHFQLDTTPLNPRRGRGYRVEPTTLGSVHLAWSSWTVGPRDSVHIVWSTGLVGVELRLIADGDSLTGVATTFHDAHMGGESLDPSARVAAVRSICSVR